MNTSIPKDAVWAIRTVLCMLTIIYIEVLSLQSVSGNYYKELASLTYRYMFASYLTIVFLFLVKDKYILGDSIKSDSEKLNRQCWILLLAPFILLEYLIIYTIIAIAESINKFRQILVGE